MSQVPPTADFEFRHIPVPNDRRVGLFGLLIAGSIGAVLAIILNNPFEGQVPSVTILGLLELCLIAALARTAIRRLKRGGHSPTPVHPAPGTTGGDRPRQLSREQTAYREALRAVAAGGELDTILSTVAHATESLLPGSLCYFVETANSGRAPRLIPRMDATDKPWSLSLVPGLSEQTVRLFPRLSVEAPELIETNALSLVDEETRELLAAHNLSSCQLRSIYLANGTHWGVLALWYPTSVCDDVEGETSVIVELATAAIERCLLIQRLQHKTNRVALAERAGNIGIWDWNVRTNKVVWSEHMEELSQLAPGSFDGSYSSWARLVFPEDLQRVEATVQKCFRERARDYYSTYRVKLLDGKTRWMESFGAIDYDSSGNPLRMVGTSSDISEQKELLARVEKDRQRLALVLDAAKLGFWDWHIPSGNVQFGGSWASMLGYAVAEVSPNVSSWEKLVHPDDLPKALERLTHHLGGKIAVYECEHRLRKKDGSWLWVLDRGQVVERDASGNPVRALGIHADISEQRATQEALKLSAKRKDEFLATLAHELRNPLAPLRTGLEILKRNDLPPNTKRARDMMERQLLQMVRLIDDLLDVARITQGKLELKRAIINLQETVEAGIEGAMPLVDSAGHRLVVEMPEEAIQLSGDATRLAQVVSNLLSNAAKYTPQGGTIALRVFRTNGTATISVSDSGLGIPRDMLESIFDMFGQVNQTLDRSQGGLGIGLAIVRKIVEMHGGDVRAESAGIGKGSAFTVHIPVTKGSVMTDEKKSAPRSASEAEPRMILVVDDNVDGAESMALFINMAGHKAEVAHDGPQALAALEHGMPDIIFLDIGLPSMTGYEVAKKIRSLPGGEHVRLVALTGWGTEADKLKAQEAGFTEHLTKPVDLAHIEQILGTASTGLSPAAAASLMAASP